MAPGDQGARTVAEVVADELIAAGAEAVILTGSWARDEGTPESDIDLHALGVSSSYRLARREGYLLSLTWEKAESVREAFHDPLSVGGAVGGWRQAVILADPLGRAATLQRQARAWTWDVIGAARCDSVVANGIAGLAEEVHKLVVHRQETRFTGPAQRAILALRLAFPLALHFRLVYPTENKIWDLVSNRMGERWMELQRAAFAGSDEAALEMYYLAAHMVKDLLTSEEAAVVHHACVLAGHPL